MFLGKEVDFARSLLDKQHEFNGISLEVNKMRQCFYLGRFYQTNLLLSPQSRYMFETKKLF